MPTQLNAPHRAMLGWLPPSRIADVEESGVYRVATSSREAEGVSNKKSSEIN